MQGGLFTKKFECKFVSLLAYVCDGLENAKKGCGKVLYMPVNAIKDIMTRRGYIGSEVKCRGGGLTMNGNRSDLDWSEVGLSSLTRLGCRMTGLQGSLLASCHSNTTLKRESPNVNKHCCKFASCCKFQPDRKPAVQGSLPIWISGVANPSPTTSHKTSVLAHTGPVAFPLRTPTARSGHQATNAMPVEALVCSSPPTPSWLRPSPAVPLFSRPTPKGAHTYTMPSNAACRTGTSNSVSLRAMHAGCH